jgi:hypothetical protein
MMKRVTDSGKMTIRNFRDWPVFENVRKDSKFVEAFEREFGEKLLLDTETKNLDTKQEESPSGDPEASAAAATMH